MKTSFLRGRASPWQLEQAGSATLVDIRGSKRAPEAQRSSKLKRMFNEKLKPGVFQMRVWRALFAHRDPWDLVAFWLLRGTREIFS